MKRRWLPFVLSITGLLVSLQALTGAETPKVPQFKITSAKLKVDLGATPRVLVYEGNVKFTSSLHQTSITCQRLMANTSNPDAISAVEARGTVVFSLTVQPKEAGKPAYRLDGKTELLTYTMQEGNRLITLKTEKGVRPSLVITDLSSKEKSDLTGAGDVIMYNIESQTLEILGPVIENTGGAQ